MENTSAPKTCVLTETTMLSITKADIGKFIGKNGSLVRKHVINQSRDALAKESGVSFADVPPPRVTVKHLPEDDVVVAECSAASEELLRLVMSNIARHVEHISRPASADHHPKTSSAGGGGSKAPTQVQRKPRVCHLNFKTNLDDHLVGKFIGGGGKNCKALAEDLGTLTEKLGASSFRVRVVQEDIYGSSRTPSKFFFIKNPGSEEVFIHVSAMFSGNPRDLFRAIKTRMIESVTSLAAEQATNHDALDFLSSAATPFTPGTSPFGNGPFGAAAAGPAPGALPVVAEEQPELETLPDSPRYCDDEDN
jgi:predicted RNA-binding protein YlqC (UPF0109 family)